MLFDGMAVGGLFCKPFEVGVELLVGVGVERCWEANAWKEFFVGGISVRG